MPTGLLIRDDRDAYGWHTEVLRGVAACGRTFALDHEAVTREAYDPAKNETHDGRQTTRCFDCVGSHGTERPPEEVKA